MRRADAGVSVAEFTVAITLLGVAILLSAPLLYRLVEDQRASKYTNALVSTLTYARAQAVIRNQPVTVCSSNDGFQCTDTPWALGYLVFVDNDSPGVVDANDSVLRRSAPSHPKVIITLHGGRYVRFHPLGMLIAQNQNGKIAPTTLTQWLERLSPIALAHAETVSAGVSQEEGSLVSPAGAIQHGAFVVCYQDVGRRISLSLQGRITTQATSCRDKL
jgi:type IV fimbrial biogenesis protein FimT